ncbi:MAG TPA: hypothetical protein VHH33_05940, partial [Nitrososphaeraceae archaeon]|nr:hypothetical protein [Nitrososphaeraceae archaeon]
MSKQISKVFTLILISIVLVLTQVNIDSMSTSFGQVANAVLDKGLSIRPMQFGFLSELSPTEKAASVSGTCTLSPDSMRLKG